MGYDILPYPINEWLEQRLTLGKHLHEILSRYRINCVIDVGAHYGEYASFLREIGYTGKIVSFEPVRANFEQLQSRSMKDSKWEVHHMALGSEDATMEINVCHETELSSFLTPNAYCASHIGQTDLVAGTEQVQVKTIASVFETCVAGVVEPRVYLKLDTQGYDLKVLETAAGYLDRIIALQCELSIKPIYQAMPSYLEALQSIGEMGFEMTGVFPVNRDRSLRLIEVDCVMLRRGVGGNGQA
jgi:FkbM family methyltransferase